MRWAVVAILLVMGWAGGVLGGLTVLGPGVRAVPGADAPEDRLVYEHSAAGSVAVCGSWDGWGERAPMAAEGEPGRWTLDIKALGLSRGRYEFKFIIDGGWEGGDNRVLHVDETGALRGPPDVLGSVRLAAADRLEVRLTRAIPAGAEPRFRLEPPARIRRVERLPRLDESALAGYSVEGGRVTFRFDAAVYGQALDPDRDTLAVAGNFNQWSPDGADDRWRMTPAGDRGVWTLFAPLDDLHPPAGEPDLQFKFVLNGANWLPLPEGAPNAVADGRGHVNLRLDPAGSARDTVCLHLAEPLPLDESHTLVVEGLADRPAWAAVSSGAGLMATWRTEKQLGAILDRGRRATHYRLFAPRARSVHLCLYDGPEHLAGPDDPSPVPPAERHPMWRDPADGTWEVSVLGLDTGRYYMFEVDGPGGDGEGFAPGQPVGDPYARAAAGSDRNAIVIDPDTTNQWFAGWTDRDWRPPAPADLVIYEAHVRDLTIHPSSGVPPELRGTFAGIPAGRGAGAGLDHLQSLGVNAIELLPIAEFHNPGGRHDWGYATTFFFAPESSYGRDPDTGAHYYEFKQMVDDLHRAGFAVLLDVVYNHAGTPNYLARIDRPYYFRLNPDLSFSNFSGVGNDCRSESPMMRRLIIDNVLYWMREHHVDGFRLDLAELIDLDTLRQLEREARALDPEVILISEPWSFRGNHKDRLTGTGWAAWNDDFRNRVKAFIQGRGNRGDLCEVLVGSTALWAAHPLQAVNYLESHDDMTLADEISTVAGQDARTLTARDARVNRLGATLLFTSLGMQMLAEGQEFLRSKGGIHNSYDRGDAVNALDWGHRERPLARETMAWYQGLIRLLRSGAGRSFRIAERPPDDYYRWILPGEERALGYLVNAPRRYPGAGFAVLVNAADMPVSFATDLPAGAWRMIGDGERIEPDGIPGADAYPAGGPVRLTVPAQTAFLLRDGF